MSEFQNIAVIGASQAGISFANAIVNDLPGNYRILLIDALDYAFWPLSAIRASVKSGWEKRLTIPLSNGNVFKAGTQHRVIAPNKVVELKKSSLILEKPFEGSKEVLFYKCIIATGAQQPTPMRPAPGSTEKEYLNLIRENQRDIAKATKVVVVGGGAVGVELAGEIRAVHPTKSITIVHNNSKVLDPQAVRPDLNKVRSSWSSPPTNPKLSVALEKDLKGLKIDVIHNDKVAIPANVGGPSDWDGSFGLQSSLKSVTLESGKKLQADYVFISVGNKPNVSLVEKVDSGAIISGLVGVNEYLQVISTNEKSSPFPANYYAIGDCCSTPGWKNVQGAQTDGNAAAVNVLAQIKKTPLKAYTRPLPFGFLIPLGPNTGKGSLTVPIFGDVMLPVFMVKSVKAQKLFVEDLFYGRFKGAEKLTPPPVPV